MMLTVDQGKMATRYARRIVEQHVKNQSFDTFDFDPVFQEKRGVFVTLNTFPDNELRGCIGIPEPVMALTSALKEAAISSTHDPRFFPLSEQELAHIIIEVTILTKPELITVQRPAAYPQQITIGKDGLIIKYRGRSGLLLPQVPVEYQWDAEEFLTHLCVKAGLSPDSWFEKHAKIYRFSGQIFSEKKPYGIIEETLFDGI